MNAHEELGKIATYNALIEEKTEDLIKLDSLAKKMTAALGGEAVQRSRNNDPLGVVIASKEKVAMEIAGIQEKLDKQKEFLSGIIDGLKNPVYIKVLYGLFFNGKVLKEVADHINYSYRHTQNLRDIAIKEVQKIMDKIESSHRI